MFLSILHNNQLFLCAYVVVSSFRFLGISEFNIIHFPCSKIILQYLFKQLHSCWYKHSKVFLLHETWIKLNFNNLTKE